MSIADPNSAERAYAHLKTLVVDFTVKPSERLNELELSEKLGMSRGPVREALNRLAVEGLLTSVPNRGFFCRSLTVQEIQELYDVRADLEVAALRQAAERASADAIETLGAFWKAAVEEADATSTADLVRLDEEFHDRIAIIAGNAQRLRFLRGINERIRFIRRINIEMPGRREASFREHTSIVDSMRDCDVEGACAILRQHVRKSVWETKDLIKEALARIYSE